MTPRDLSSRFFVSRTAGFAAAAFTSLALLAGCSGKDAASGAGASGGSAPPPSVGVVTVQPQAVPLQTELPGRVEA